MCTCEHRYPQESERAWKTAWMLELQAVVNHHPLMLGTKLKAVEKALIGEVLSVKAEYLPAPM